MHQYIEIMDTTLRDGEQTDGVSFSTFEKMQIARYLLENLKVDRIELASARVSAGEEETTREVFQWARERGLDRRIEILGFVDHTHSVDWIRQTGGSVINLLAKGSLRHCEQQLGKSLVEHLLDIERTVQYAVDNGVKANIYLEDWSNGFLDSPDYVREMLRALKSLPIHRFLFPDTLGIMSPAEVRAGIGDALNTHPDLAIDFHGHNDYNLAVANCMAAVEAGVRGLHVAVNGLGERAGNAPLESVVTALHDKLKVKTGVQEIAIMGASRLVETFSGKRIQSNRPIVGQDVYTQTAGIHADGDKKNNLYANPILPERFGRKRVYALGKLAGRASITNNLRMMGIELSDEKEKLLLERIKQLGDQKKTVTADDLPFLIEDLFGSKVADRRIVIEAASVRSELSGRPLASIRLTFHGETYESEAEGDGGYDAFMNALAVIAEKLNWKLPALSEYEVRIPPGGKTDALVETVIVWDSEATGRTFRTVGVATDQVIAAIRATEKMLNRLFQPLPISVV
ncbi:MAG: 2-isopropylmalate synthase [Leptospiraceae bacterium]|nr:2-isopropylmalate synthase [Leptospiraceae bacterium]